jgi:hypothetical protein
MTSVCWWTEVTLQDVRSGGPTLEIKLLPIGYVTDPDVGYVSCVRWSL